MAKKGLASQRAFPHTSIVPGSLNQVNIGVRSVDWSSGFKSLTAPETLFPAGFGLFRAETAARPLFFILHFPTTPHGSRASERGHPLFPNPTIIAKQHGWT
ncbi:MAG TPA: hypothetical protein VD994_10820 [Prosthecobacter sp.]|nr:hypothetical protein [Prosthecobacter sp.]